MISGLKAIKYPVSKFSAPCSVSQEYANICLLTCLTYRHLLPYLIANLGEE
jgi:BarA-like signal transduction histidine kinase